MRVTSLSDGEIGVERDGGGVAVKAVKVRRAGGAGGAQVTAGAERGVDIKVTGAEGERCQRFGEQDGDMGRAHAAGSVSGRPRACISAFRMRMMRGSSPGRAR